MKKNLSKTIAILLTAGLMAGTLIIAGCSDSDASVREFVKDPVSVSEADNNDVSISEETKEEEKEVIKEETKEEIKEETKEEAKEESADSTEVTTSVETETTSTETKTEPAVDDKKWNNTSDISWIEPGKKIVAISFDDGPVSPVNDKSSAMRIQKALTENGMHATFFYWGFTLNDQTKKELTAAYEAGFELANHTNSHPDLTTLTNDQIDKELSTIRKVLTEITGQEKFLIRPPYLACNQSVKDAMTEPLISCALDSKDWAGASAQDIIDTISKAAENGSLEGKIVLMHETYETTAEAVEYLLPYLKEQGYVVATISEMYKYYGKDMYAGKMYTDIYIKK